MKAHSYHFHRFQETKNPTRVVKDFSLAFPGMTVSRRTVFRIVEEFEITGARQYGGRGRSGLRRNK